MDEYWKKVHDKAFADMTALLAGYMVVEDTCDGMHKALVYVMRRGSCRDQADAIAFYGDYKWWAHEVAAHNAEVVP
jgi:hypothetical protein